MNRRNFLKLLGGTAATFVMPEIIVPERRFWALDQTMLSAADRDHQEAWKRAHDLRKSMIETYGGKTWQEFLRERTRLMVIRDGSPYYGDYVNNIKYLDLSVLEEK